MVFVLVVAERAGIQDAAHLFVIIDGGVAKVDFVLRRPTCKLLCVLVYVVKVILSWI